MNGQIQKKQMIIGCIFLLIIASLTPVSLSAQQKYTRPLAQIQKYNSQLDNSAEKSSLDKKIDVNFTKKSIDHVLKEIAGKAGLKITYRGDIMVEKNVTIKARNITVKNALSKVLEAVPLSYKLTENRYLLILPQKTLNEAAAATVAGRVTDAETNNTLPGVNILIKGTSNGTSTDTAGHYSLTVPSLQDTLVFSYIGYEKQIVPINGRTTVNIALKSKTLSGEQMVVVGYGTESTEELTGSISQIDESDIEDQPVADISDALQGAAPNLTIQQTNGGAPGGGVNIDIRGISTMNNNSPLVVIDGVVGANLSNLNPDNIKNISVLKDAASAAIYGSRAANGVILVTTKSGQKNTEPTVTFSEQTGVNAPNIRYKPVSGYKNAILRNQAEINSGNSPRYAPGEIRTLKENGDIDWYMNTILDDAVQQNYNVAVSGGDENTTYRASARYFNQENNFVGGYGLKRYNARLNLNTEYGKFEVKTNLAFQRSKNKTPAAIQQFLIADARRTPTYYNYQLQADNGHYLINDVLSEQNPLGQLEGGGATRSTNNTFNGLLQVQYEIVKGLEARAEFSTIVDANTSLLKGKEVKYYASPTASTYASTSGSSRPTNDDNYNAIRINPKFVLDYDGSIGEKHDISGLLGISENSFTSKSNSIHKQYTDPDLNIPTSETEILDESQTTPETKSESRLYSAFGRAKYSYDHKYHFEFDFRYDGSSKFAEGNRWGFFPSFSAAWDITDEPFMNSYRNNIGDLKIRASYGTLGNQSVGNYQYQTSYFPFTNAYAFNNTAVSGTGFTFANKDIRWETTSTLNFGLDASFLENRLQTHIDIYQKNTRDILITPTVPGTYGGAVPNYNAGGMRNRGWEFSADYNFDSGAFSHSIGVNVSDTWNTVTNFVGNENIDSFDGMARIIRVGEPFNSYYGYKTDGYFQNAQEIQNGAKPIGFTPSAGDVRFKDLNDDGVITPEDDRKILGNAFPRYTFGVQYGLKWKGFNLNMIIQGVGKRTMNLRGETVEPFHANYSYTMYTHQLDFWTPTNPDARWPRLSSPNSASDNNNYHKNSDLQLFNASYARLKNIRLGYTLPDRWSLGAKKIHLYLNAQNLFTLSNIDFIDPQSTGFNGNLNNSTGNSGRSYPAIKYYGFGVQLSL